MLSRLRKNWRVFERAKPGSRFERLHDAREGSGAARIAATVLGIALIAGGVVLLFIPGPGLLLIAFGGGLLAQESLWLARRMDRIELLLRRLYRRGRSAWKRATPPVRSVVASASVVATGLAIYGAWVLLLRD
jgi:Putative transmembrane protein (PGPGW)